MAVHISYESQTKTFIETSTDREDVPQDPTSLAMAHLLLGSRRSFRSELQELIDAGHKKGSPTATDALLNQAVAAELLGQAPNAYLEDLVESLPAILREHTNETVQRRVLTDAVCACAWLGHAQLGATLEAWQMLPPSFAVIDSAVACFANDTLLDRAKPPKPEGPAAMLAVASFAGTRSDRHRLLATLLAHGLAATKKALAAGRKLVDEDLYDEDPHTPRATYAKPSWRFAKGELRLRIRVKGTGGALRAVAPFVEPAYAWAKDLDRFVLGKHEHGEVDGVDSKKKLGSILADPEREVVLEYVRGTDAFLEEKSVRLYQSVLDGVSAWMKTRHAEKFAARLTIACPSRG